MHGAKSEMPRKAIWSHLQCCYWTEVSWHENGKKVYTKVARI